MAHCVLALVSGGLDSLLAARTLQSLGVRVIPVHFSHPWGCMSEDVLGIITRQLGVEPRIIAGGSEFIGIVRTPRFGHGRHMNPCLDCRVFMLRSLIPMLEETGSSAIVTGEVLGQRPMSQVRRQIRVIDREVGLEGRILRPLSAKRLFPTQIELDGIVDRSRLFNFSGRSRVPQLALARELGITEHLSPAGGCFLTNESFIPRLQDFLKHYPDNAASDAELLRIGRHMRVSPELKLVVARNEEESVTLEEIALAADNSGYAAFSPDQFDGPTVLACGDITSDVDRLVGGVILRYSRRQSVPSSEGFPIRVMRGASERRFFASDPLDADVVASMLIGYRPGSVCGAPAGRTTN